MSQPSASMSSADRDIVDYGRISGWALAAFLLGLLSTTAIVGPILWFIPVMTAVISIVAMRRIQASEHLLSGWHLALLGLLLAVFFGAAGPARTLSRQYFIQVRASHFAAKYLELLQQNQPLAAYQFTLSAGSRVVIEPGQTEPKDKSPETKKKYEEFLALAPVKTLLAAGPTAKIEPLSASFTAGDDIRDDIAVKFRILRPASEGGKSTDLLMYVERTLAYGSHTEQWQVLARTMQEEPAPGKD